MSPDLYLCLWAPFLERGIFTHLFRLFSILGRNDFILWANRLSVRAKRLRASSTAGETTCFRSFRSFPLRIWNWLIPRSLIGIPRRRFSGIAYNIDTHTGLIFASDARIEKLCADLNDICPSLEFCACVHVKNIASWSDYFNVRQLWECYPDYDQIFASYYQFSEFVEFPCLRARSSKARVYFWRDKLRTLCEILFSPIPFVPPKVLFTGRGGFIFKVLL